MSKSKKPLPKYTVIVDTREKTPWTFKAEESCCGSISRKLEHGDYSIDGLEDILFIERKASPNELAKNVIEDRFYRELDSAFELYQHRYIVCEFSFNALFDFPWGNNLKPSLVKKIKIRGPYILSRLMDYQTEKGFHLVFCDNKLGAQKYTKALFKKIVKKELT